MGTTLTGTTPQDTYDSLIKVTDNGPLSATAKYLSDGLGNDSALALSNARVGIGTASPSNLLHLNKSSEPELYIQDSVATFRLGINSDNQFFVYTAQAKDIYFSNNNAERLRITSAGNVGIGTSAPSSPLEVAGVAKATFSVVTSENSISSSADASRFFAVSGDTGSTSYNGTSIGQAGISGFSSTGIFVVGGFKPILPKGWTGTVVLEAVCNNTNFATQVFIQTSTDGSSWTTQATATTNGTLTYTASSGLSVDTFLRIVLSSGSGSPVSENVCQFSNLRINSYNVLMDAFNQGQIKYPSLGIASLSGGLAFNNDTAAANALDDYEEGTWTMGVSFGGASVGVTYGANTGTYTKIGRQVTVNGYMLITSKGSSTGNALLTGLPFTIPNSQTNLSTASLWINSITFLNQHQAVGKVNTTSVEFWEITTLGTATQLDDTNFSNNCDAIINFTYFV